MPDGTGLDRFGQRHPGRVYGYCTLTPCYPDEIQAEMDSDPRFRGVVRNMKDKIHGQR